MIDDRLADELERIGVEGRVSILAEFAASSRVGVGGLNQENGW